jgi:hypothetical protein
MPRREAGKEADDASESTQTRSGFQGQGRTYGAARRRDGGGANGPFRGSSPPDLRLEEGADGCGAQVANPDPTSPISDKYKADKAWGQCADETQGSVKPITDYGGAPPL